MPEMHSLQSSNLAACGYDAETKTLTVQFANGSEYTYSGVPEETYEGLLSASSPGQYFHRHIKGFFSHSGG